MSGAAGIYGQGLYTLAKEEALDAVILQQLQTLQTAFSQQPDFLKLLGSANLPKEERLRIIDDSFRGSVEPYVLNFLKLLTERGYIAHFADAFADYQAQYNRDQGILQVRAVSAVALTPAQQEMLTEKLTAITGKKIQLVCKVDASVLGGVRLSYNGVQVDGTVESRLQAMEKMLKNTIL